MSDLVGNSKDWFSDDAVHIIHQLRQDRSSQYERRASDVQGILGLVVCLYCGLTS